MSCLSNRAAFGQWPDIGGLLTMDEDHSGESMGIGAKGPSSAGTAALQLVRDYASELRNALASFGGRSSDDMTEYFAYDVIKRLVSWIEGYVALLQVGNRETAQLCVRPMFEAMFKVRAVQTDPAVFFRICYKEYRDGISYIDGFDRETRDADLKAWAHAWDDFKCRYGKRHPRRALEEKKITTEQLAEMAGLTELYEGSYRPFSQITHASYMAVSGGFDDLTENLHLAVCRCALECAKALGELGASNPAFGELMRRHEKAAALCSGKQAANNLAVPLKRA